MHLQWQGDNLVGWGKRWQTIPSVGQPVSHAVRGPAVLPAPAYRFLVRRLGPGPVHVPAGADPLGVPSGPGGRAVRRHAGLIAGVEDPRRAARGERGGREGTRGGMEGPD